jgi:hypothetical protein
VAILKLPRFWSSGGRTAAAYAAQEPEADGLDAFGSETSPVTADAAGPWPVVRAVAPAPLPVAHPKVRWVQVATWVGVVAVSASIAVAGVFLYQRRFAPSARTGSLTIHSTPTNAEVLIAGKSVGATPITLPLAAGTHDVQVAGLAQRRTIKVEIAAGTSTVQHLELGAAPVAAALSGTLRIQSEPSNLAVEVDGVQRGQSPLTVDRVDPGEHSVSIRTERGVINKTVTVRPGETLSLVLSAGAPAAEPAVTGGWLSIASPVAMQLREGGKVIGTTETDRLMLQAGDHTIDIVNEALGFRLTRKVRIAAGKTAAIAIDLPNGTLHINAQPWAEVWLDGERVGETPIGNLQRPIGTHQVLFRHPELGERRETVVVTAAQPVRLGVDLRKK